MKTVRGRRQEKPPEGSWTTSNFSHLKAASEICLVVTAGFFLGKVFVCLLNSVSVRPTVVLTALRDSWYLVYQVAKRHGGEDGDHRDGAPAKFYSQQMKVKVF